MNRIMGAKNFAFRVLHSKKAEFKSPLKIQKRSFNESNLQNAIKDIETRWILLPEAERGAIADALAAKQAGDWKNLSIQEKRAGMIE